MRARLPGLFCLTTVVALGTGCVTTTTSDNDGRSVRLPTGVTLLDSDRDECAGSVAIEEGIVANAVRSDLVIQPGENVTFAVDADDDDDIEVEWTCVGAASTDRNAVVCPDETSHVRITRGTGNDFTLECYGNRRSSAAGNTAR